MRDLNVTSLLAEGLPDAAEAEKQAGVDRLMDGINQILWVTLAAIIFLCLVFVLRRLVRWWTRRQLSEIEQDREERKQSRETDRADAWSVGAERYIDRDKLPDPGPDDPPLHDHDHPDHEGADAAGSDPDHDEPEEEHDPYGLFEDKPYRDPVDEDDEDDDDEEDEDEDLDDERR